MAGTTVFSYSNTVTESDVVWVVSQVRAELDQFKLLYPKFITEDRINTFTRSIQIFLRNDVISAARIIIATETESGKYLSWDQRIFRFNHTLRSGRQSFDKHDVAAGFIPDGAEALSFMTFNDRMIAMSPQKQEEVLAGTPWSHCAPGSGSSKIEYRNSPAQTGIAWSRNLGVERWQ